MIHLKELKCLLIISCTYELFGCPILIILGATMISLFLTKKTNLDKETAIKFKKLSLNRDNNSEIDSRTDVSQLGSRK